MIFLNFFKELVEKDIKKRKKDPNAPKRPLSAYMYFCSNNRDQIKKNNPELKLTEVAMRLGQMWKDMSDDDKQV